MIDYIKLCNILVPDITIDKTTEEYKTFLRSIQESGVINPVIVSPVEGDKYRLVTGLYRYVASIDAKKKTIPAQIHKMTEQEIEEVQLLHCKHRIETTPADYAKAIKRLMSRHTVEEIAIKINRSVAWVKEKIK